MSRNTTPTPRESESPIRVLHVLTTGLIGGTEAMALRLASHREERASDAESVHGLDAESNAGRSVRHELAILKPGGPMAELAQEAGVPYHPDARRRSALARWRGLRKIFRRERFDIVQLYGLQADAMGRRAAKRSGAAVVSAIRSVDPWRRFWHTALDRLTQRWVDRWISNSEAGKLAAMARQPIAPEVIEVVHNGVEAPPKRDNALIEKTRADWAEQAGIPPEESSDGRLVVFTCLANLRWMKGHETLVRAFAQIVQRAGRQSPPSQNFEAVLALIGADGPPPDSATGDRPPACPSCLDVAAESAPASMAEHLEQVAAELGVRNRVLILGPSMNPGPWLDASDVIVLASEHEGFPTSLVEGMAHGLPVIATNVGGIPEMFEDGLEGALVSPGDIEGLARAMQSTACDAELRTKQGEAGRKRWRDEYTIEEMVRRHNAIYRSLV